jgi:hypothetical protein
MNLMRLLRALWHNAHTMEHQHTETVAPNRNHNYYNAWPNCTQQLLSQPQQLLSQPQQLLSQAQPQCAL